MFVCGRENKTEEPDANRGNCIELCGHCCVLSAEYSKVLGGQGAMVPQHRVDFVDLWVVSAGWMYGI